MKVKLYISPLKNKKFRAIFYKDNGEKIKHTDFGAKGMSDFIEHKNEERKQRFKNRFQKLINKYKNDATKPMTLSDMVLWNKPDLEKSWKDYKKTYNLK